MIRLGSDRGAVELVEASLIYPIIFIFVASLLIFSLKIYNLVYLYNYSYVNLERLVQEEDLSREDLMDEKTGGLNIKDYSYHIKKGRWGLYDRYESTISYREGLAFKSKIQLDIDKYHLGEAKYIRQIDFLNSLGDLFFNTKTRVGEDNKDILQEED